MAAPTENLPILTVTQLTNAIKMCLESTFPIIWLQGEISNCKLHTSGHLYLSLKDQNAQKNWGGDKSNGCGDPRYAPYFNAPIFRISSHFKSCKSSGRRLCSRDCSSNSAIQFP